ncbi:toll/interleukin-1 receptor domain-containing protein [Aurantibacillus circumpalustris]|uniref:toll/interleukin-1 receptor domain-containing protein n=1 Tax=Aurantibacillus circumpalustris TaxID=3036359 RepID=UPI00295BC25D|nr:toll/interleukin-1 receptor domain-containing protein [Aurantibacillus circumpalustris]
MAKLKAFISHSSKDKAFVRKLKEDLDLNEIDTWIDEDELKVGDKLYDSLMLGLGSSSHFLVILSDNIKGSEWVEAEINEAIKNFDKKTLRKIIPVLLRKTDIPKGLQDLFRADFSKITFTLKNDKLNFIGDSYHTEVEKIIKAIKSSTDFTLNSTEKDKIFERTEQQTSNGSELGKIIGLYKVIGFASKESRINLINHRLKKYPQSLLTKVPKNKIMPICLPNLVKQVFGKRLMGEEIYVTIQGGQKKFIGHFCGYVSNGQFIVIPKEIRTLLNLRSQSVYTVEINGINKTITFIKR